MGRTASLPQLGAGGRASRASGSGSTRPQWRAGRSVGQVQSGGQQDPERRGGARGVRRRSPPVRREPRVQEAVEKAEALSAYPDLDWAMIGHLQTNKAKDVAGFAREFHAPGLDQDRRGAEPAAAFTAASSTSTSRSTPRASRRKFEHPDQVEPFARALGQFGALRVRGLMTLAGVLADRTPWPPASSGCAPCRASSRRPAWARSRAGCRGACPATSSWPSPTVRQPFRVGGDLPGPRR